MKSQLLCDEKAFHITSEDESKLFLKEQKLDIKK